MPDKKRYVTLEDLAYFLEKIKEMLAGENKNEIIEGDGSQEKGDKE